MVLTARDDGVVRARALLGVCATDHSCTSEHIGNLLSRVGVLEYVRGMPVLELGPGSQGGLRKYVLSQGAVSYLGVDICPSSVSKAQEMCPRGVFVCDDPREVIPKLSEEHTILSSAVLDTFITHNNSYVQALVDIIGMHTSAGRVTVHFSPNISERAQLFERAGFERIHCPIEALGIFRKK